MSRELWIAVGAVAVLAAAIGGPVAFRRRWPRPLIALCIAVFAALLTLSITRAFGWRAYYAFLLVLFPVHGLVFGLLAWRRRRPRYALLVVTFAALTGVAWIRFHNGDAPAWLLGLRGLAIGCTLGSVALLWRERRSA